MLQPCAISLHFAATSSQLLYVLVLREKDFVQAEPLAACAASWPKRSLSQRALAGLSIVDFLIGGCVYFRLKPSTGR